MAPARAKRAVLAGHWPQLRAADLRQQALRVPDTSGSQATGARNPRRARRLSNSVSVAATMGLVDLVGALSGRGERGGGRHRGQAQVLAAAW